MKINEGIFLMQEDWEQISDPMMLWQVPILNQFIRHYLIRAWHEVSFAQMNKEKELRVIWNNGYVEVFMLKTSWAGDINKKPSKSVFRRQKFPRSHYWPKDLERIL